MKDAKRVVCINDAAFKSDLARFEVCLPHPIKGEIYTPDGVCPRSGYLYLVEFNFDNTEGIRIAFNYKFFRPIHPIGDQVETHIQELIKKEDLQTISV